MASPAQKPLTAPSKNEGPFSSPEKQTLILCLLLAAITLVLYNPVSRYPFINYDDDRYVIQNAHIRGISGETVRWAFTTTAEANWHPLTWLSHALDYQLFHLNAAGHHLTSELFHAVNVVLLFLVLVKATRRVGRSFVVAALWAMHPINVESVAWVAERKNLLCTFFFLLALWAYGWYARRPEWRRYLVVAACFACGLMSKPMVITLPFVLLLMDYWPLGRFQQSSVMDERRCEQRLYGDSGQEALPQRTLTQLLVEKLPLLALSAASALITMYVQRAGGAVRSGQQFPFGVRLENSVVAYAMYLWKMIWPAHLAVLYPHPGNTLAGWQIALSLGVLAAISGVVRRFRSRGYLVSGWPWFLGALVPTIGLVQVGYQSMADRYAYIPLIGIFVMVVWGAADLADHFKLGVAWRIVPAVVVLLAVSWAGRRQLGYWDSPYDLWTHTLGVNPKNFIAEDNLGDALLMEGKADEAYAHFQRAAEIMPRDPWSHTNMGAYLQQHGRLQEAIAEYQTTIRLTRDRAMLALTYANMGSAYRELGDEQTARESYDKAIALNPNQLNAYLGRGLLLDKQNKPEQAAADFAKSVELQPTAEGYLFLGRELAKTGQRAQALASFQEALKISPDMVEAQQAAAALTAH